MKQTLLIALLALAGFSSLPAAADEAPAASAPEATQAAAPDNLAAPGKPCPKPGMGMGPGPGMGMGMGPGMGPGPAMAGKPGMMMMGGGRACAKPGHGCKMHEEMSHRVEQLEKRIDALQMTIELLTRQQAK